MNPVRRTRDGGLRLSRWRLHLLLFGIFAQTVMATMTAEATAQEVLENLMGAAESWKYSAKACYLALLTGTPATSGSEGVTMAKVHAKECSVTGYSRFQWKNEAGNKSKLKFGTSAGKGYVENEEEAEVETGLSGSNQEITYWALCTHAWKVGESSGEGEAGKVIAWGSCTGTSIGGTGTPVKVAAGKLKLELG